MNRAALTGHIRTKSSFLCVGLDSDIDKIPAHLHREADPVLEFNRQIIAATQDHCIAYKINTAFYESMGAAGWKTLEETLALIPKTHFSIADAKRGDIGNTAKHYARAFFETLSFDAVTLSPYMGEDSISPFLEYTDKWVILLGLTSNKGAADFQLLDLHKGRKLYEEVLLKSSSWGSADQMMFVAGATRLEQLREIRQLLPDHFLLVPGIGAQGGSLQEVYQNAHNTDVGLLVNSSREIIFSSSGKDFAETAGQKAKEICRAMKDLLR